MPTSHPLILIPDTNYLYAGKGKPATKTVLNLLELAKKAGATVYLIAPVRTELLEKCREELTKAAIGLKEASQWVPALPELKIKELVAQYEAQLDNLVREHGMVAAPFPTQGLPSHEELFAKAAAKEPPFDKAGRSFRDAMIFYAAQELQKRTPDSTVLLMSSDQDFQRRVKELGNKAIIVASADEVSEGLKSHVSEEEQRYLRQIAERVREVLQKDSLPQLTDYLSSEFMVPDIPMNIQESLESIDRIVLENVSDVESLFVSDTGTVTFNAKVHGSLLYTVKTSQRTKLLMQSALLSAFKKPRRVGESQGLAPVWSIMGASDQTYSEQRRLDYWFEVECEGRIDEEAKLTEVKPVRIVDSGRDYLATSARLEAADAFSEEEEEQGPATAAPASGEGIESEE